MECIKVKFSSEEYADFHIKKHKKRNDVLGLEARSYKCNRCSSWHITSKLSYQELIDDNEDLHAQVVREVQKQVDLKAEIDYLCKLLKAGKIKKRPNPEPMIQQLNEKVRKQQKEISDLRDIRNKLLYELNKK